MTDRNAPKYALDVNPNKDTINVESQINESTSILNHYKNLINLRKKEKTLTLGDTKLIDLDKNIVAYERKFENERFFVAVNMSTDSVSIKESTLQSMTPLMSNNYHNNKLESYGYVIYKG